MVEKLVTEYFDDLDGQLLDADYLHTLTWSWLGVNYQFDTSTANLAKIDNGQVSVATLLTASTRITDVHLSSSANAAIRSWAREHGHPIGNRGRISAEIVSAYNCDVDQVASIPAPHT
ncbi:Lsr2 family protein [Williamsia sp. 1135]|uniref:histone-like nucleoid-structuring protein Lsr2 n=1 Tax=Williamsia sp. 1135 TaxID=1889262 RepID=UPI000A0F59E5|nr:Lsr2 family protein [Williamsia sp. 1135]ORM37531.1 hypothetical protein BFL43_03810 [Williamsia sp. 1135]